MNLKEFERILQESWSKESSYSPEDWSKSNPSCGQCAVTALLVNDYFDGDIVWCEVSLPDDQKVSHYFNLVDHKEVDLTRAQFPKGSIIQAGIVKRKDFVNTRAYILSNEETRKRYELLKERFANHVNFVY